MGNGENKQILTNQRERFCLEYIIDLNQTKAAIRAGYAASSAQQTGSRLMLIDVIQERIQELREKQNKQIEQKYTISRELILDKLAKHAIANIEEPSGDEMNRDYKLNVYNSLSRNQLKAIEIINGMMGYDKPVIKKKEDVSINIEFTDAPNLNDLEGFEYEDSEQV